MRTLLRASPWAVGCTALLVLASWAYGSWQQGVANCFDLAGASRLLAGELRRGEGLSLRDGAMMRRLEDKQKLVDEMLRGGLTLREAGDLFRRVDEETTEAGAAADDASSYRSALSWAEFTARGRPGAAARIAQFREELDGLLHPKLHGA